MKSSAAQVTLILISLASIALAQKVQIRVSDGTDDIPTRSITISGKGKTIDAPQNTVFQLDYGVYTIDVEASGMKTAALPIVIDQPKQIVMVALSLGAMEGVEPPPCSIVGDIPADSKITRIRVVQLYGSYLADVPVDPSGKFQVRNLICGDYLVVAMERSRLVGTMTTRAEVLGPRLKLNLMPPSDAH